MENKLVDIIIPVHDRPDHTKQTLESLLKNTSEELYNLYIVDDASYVVTGQYLRDFVHFYFEGQEERVLTDNFKNIGPAASRNKVCKKITEKYGRSRYLYHSDNDVFFTEGWLEKLIVAYEQAEKNQNVYKVKLLGGGCHPYLQNNAKLTLQFNDGPLSIGLKDAVSGYSQLMTWETWDKYGPFDEGQGNQEIKIMGSEDWAFCQRIIKDGFRVGSIEPEVVIATGKTNTYGNPATGSETFKDVPGVIIK